MKTQAMKTALACVLFALLAACNSDNTTPAQTTIDVAIIHASDPLWADEVAAKLSANTKVASATVIDGSAITPTLAELQMYDAVMLMPDGSLLDPATLGDNVADYVDACGGVVLTMFSYNVTPLTGRFATDNYFVIQSGTWQTQGVQQTLGTVHDAAHPIMAGVTSFDGGTSSYRPDAATLVAGSNLIAEWTDGMPLVTTRTLANGANRADLGFYPPSSDSRSDFWDPTTDGVAMMANALEWVTTGCN